MRAVTPRRALLAGALDNRAAQVHVRRRSSSMSRPTRRIEALGSGRQRLTGSGRPCSRNSQACETATRVDAEQPGDTSLHARLGGAR